MRAFLFLVLCKLLILLIPASVYGQNKFVVKGIVCDSLTGEYLNGASIISDVGLRNTYTHSDGTYTIKLPKGGVLLDFSYVGYITQEVQLTITCDTILNVRLQPNPDLDEITIYARQTDLGARSTQMGTVSIPVAQVKKAPALLGEPDIMKMVQLLPGIHSGGDGFAGVYIRGGSYDQNNMTMGGITIYNAEHLKGFVSAFNPDVIEEIVVHKGSFPARYGGHISSVIEAKMKDGNFESFHGAGSLGMLSAKLFAEGPIIKEQTSFIVSARISYFNLFTRPILEKIYDKTEALSQFANMSYFDINTKITHKFSKKSKISALFYCGGDRVNLDGEMTKMETQQERQGKIETYRKSNQEDTDNNWGNILAGVHWNRIYGEKTFLNTGLYFSRFRYELNKNSAIKEESIPLNNPTDSFYQHTNSSIKFLSGIEDYNLNSDVTSLLTANNTLSAGMKLSIKQFSPIVKTHRDITTMIASSQTVDVSDINTGNPSKLFNGAIYVEDKWRVNDLFTMNMGLRINIYGVKDKIYIYPEPRVNIRILMTDNFSIKTSYSYMSQALHGLNSANLVMPSDIWVPVSNQIVPLTSHQASLGFFYDLNESGIRFSLEGYYKTMNNVLEYRDGITFFNTSEGWENKVAIGKGTSYGVEFLAQKSVGRTTGWIAYTWSKSLRKFNREGNVLNNGDVFFAKNDCRNNLSMTISHQISKKWEVSGTFVYHTGYRATLSQVAFIGRYIPDLTVLPVSYLSSSREPVLFITSGQQPDQVNLDGYQRLSTYLERNGFVMDDYHRLDIAINYYLVHKRGKSTLSINIYNVYNRMNAYAVYPAFDSNRYVLKKLGLFPFMPSLSYSYQF